ncbi:MAG TPA: DUF2020 domain-containing protein [Pseudonocardiaceae bacterium]|nr:DUF2020 domain-containing protein [Pseudonocardiaceae bacterium]
MRAAALIVPCVLGLLLAGCGPGGGTTAGVAAPVSTITTHVLVTTPSVAAPPAPRPSVRASSCPYLKTQDAAYDNGQKVSSVKVSSAADGQPHPACFFYRSDGQLLLTVWVHVDSPAVATAIVDQAAPIATSNPETRPAGWHGGSVSQASGAVYAIANGGTSIVVTSNRPETVNCRLVAEQVVTDLGA